MKIASVILGVLGALGGALLGLRWNADLNSAAGQFAMAMGAPEVGALRMAAHLLILCAIVGGVACVLILLDKGTRTINGFLLIIAGGLPLLVHTNAWFGLPMSVAGVLAFFIKQKDTAMPMVNQCPR